MNKYSGQNFDDFLAEEGILEEVTARAEKRVLALEIEDSLNAANPKTTAFAEEDDSTSEELNPYLLDLGNTITRELLERLIRAAG